MFKGIDPEQRKALLLALGGVLLLLVGFAVFHKRALAVAPPGAGASASASSADSSGVASGLGLDTTGAPTVYNAAPTVYQTTYNYPGPSSGPGAGPASNPYGQPTGALVTDSSGSISGAKFFAYSGVQAHRPGAVVLSSGGGNLAAAPLPYGR